MNVEGRVDCSIGVTMLKLCWLYRPFSVSPQTASVDVGALLQVDVTYKPTCTRTHLTDLIVKYSDGEWSVNDDLDQLLVHVREEAWRVLLFFFLFVIPSVLWHCWLGGYRSKDIRSVKNPASAVPKCCSPWEYPA